MNIFKWFKSSSIPEIGRDIKWINIVRHVLRVLEFDRSETSIDPNGNVVAKSKYKPYGYLLVESQIFEQKVKLPIVHRDDFLLAASVYDDAKLSELIKNTELLVTYIPKHQQPNGLAGITHALHYVLTSPGTLEKFYEVHSQMSNPVPENIFGSFVWEGEIKVGVHLNPIL